MRKSLIHGLEANNQQLKMLICLPLLVTVSPTLRPILMPSPGTNLLEDSLKRSVVLGQPPLRLKKSKASRKEAVSKEVTTKLKEEKRKAKERVSLKLLRLLLKRMRWTSLVMILRLTQLPLKL